MKGNMRYQPAIVAAVLASIPLAAWSAPVPQKKSALKKGAAEEPPRQFTLDEIIRFVEGIKKGIVSETRLRTLVMERGLDFSLPTADVEKLRASGASPELLEYLRQTARPLPIAKPAPPKPRVGTLAISCAPAECEISLNGTSRGSTRQGKLELAGLPVGKLYIDYRKAGFVGIQGSAVIEADRTVSASAALEPERAIRERFGKQLFEKILAALGGEEGLKDASYFQAQGSAKSYAKDGKTSAWTLLMRLKSPDRTFYRVVGGSITYEVSIIGPQYKSNEKLKGPIALELESDFRHLTDFQIASMIRRISTTKYTLLANRDTPVPGEDFFLQAESSADVFTIGLDADMRPQHVRFESASGLGSGLQVVYTDYVQKGKAYFPQTTQIRFPGAEQHGFEVKFDSIEVNPKLKDNDFTKLRR